MTKRRGKLKPCVWCGRVVTLDGERVDVLYDFDGCRYHARCLVAKLDGKPSPPAPERRP